MDRFPDIYTNMLQQNRLSEPLEDIARWAQHMLLAQIGAPVCAAVTAPATAAVPTPANSQTESLLLIQRLQRDLAGMREEIKKAQGQGKKKKIKSCKYCAAENITADQCRNSSTNHCWNCSRPNQKEPWPCNKCSRRAPPPTSAPGARATGRTATTPTLSL